MSDQAFEIKSAALLTADALNTFIFDNLRKPSRKQPQMSQNVQQFYNQYNSVFAEFLRTIMFTLLFEDHQQVWVFQKCLHSTITMCEGGAQQGVHTSYKIVVELIERNELNAVRKQQLVEAMDRFMGPGGSGSNGFPASCLDVRSRSSFAPLFQGLRTFLYGNE